MESSCSPDAQRDRDVRLRRRRERERNRHASETAKLGMRLGTMISICMQAQPRSRSPHTAPHSPSYMVT